MTRSSKKIGLVGSKVTVQVLESADLPVIYEWRNEFALATQIKAHPMPIARHEMEEWFRRNQSDKNQLLFGIYLNDGARIVGIVRLMFIDWISQNADLGIYLGDESLRGQGIGREALTLVLCYAFDELNFHKVSLKVLESNKPAIHLYESVGYQVEGKLRDNFYHGGKHQNVLWMGILKNELVRSA